MGRTLGGPNLWSRWHDVGERILVVAWRQTGRQNHQHWQPSASKRVFSDEACVRGNLLAAPCEGARAGLASTSRIWPHTHHTSSFPRASKFGAGGGGVGLGVASPPLNVRQCSAVAVVTPRPSGNPTLSAESCRTTEFFGGHDRSGRIGIFETAAVNSSDGRSQSWLHPSELLHRCGTRGRTCAMSTATVRRDQDGAEQSSGVDQEQQGHGNNICATHSNLVNSTAARSLRRAAVATTILDPVVDATYISRASKLPLKAALPSLRNQRLGEAAVVGLQAVEAMATMPAADIVDWQQQRLGRLKDYDSRYRAPHHSSQSDAEPDDIFIPVKAFYISRSVDLKSLARGPFIEVTSSRNNLIIRCEDRPPHSPVTADNPEMACLGFLKERYMVVFQYGSVVFFNFGDLEEVESLDAVRKYCSDEFRETRKDDYGVLVRPTLAEWSEGGHDRVMLRTLDVDNIRVISSILGQSIALDHYAKKVDEMVTTFSELNRGMEQTGTFTMTRKSLFQLVAAANTTLADVILRLGLLERSDAAWKDANYAQIWEYLRDDFELDERFESLDFKLNIIQHNVRFFLEILQNRKSDTLEWIIILLITGEICVSLYDILHTAGAL